MTPEQRKRQAESLAKNDLLPELIDSRRDDILEAWESETEPEKREQHWQQLKATNDLKDFIYGSISKLAKSGDG